MELVAWRILYGANIRYVNTVAVLDADIDWMQISPGNPRQAYTSPVITRRAQL